MRSYAAISIPKNRIDEEIAAEIEAVFKIAVLSPYRDSDYFEHAGVMSYTHNFASDGRFDELEELLKQKRVPFDRYSGEVDECPPVKLYYRPDGEKEESLVVLDYEGNEFVPAAELRQLLTCSASEALEGLQKLLKEYSPIICPIEDYVGPQELSSSLNEV